MRDSTHGKEGWAWAFMVLIRFLCSRRGAAAGRAAILTCSLILFGVIAAAGYWGPGLVHLVWDRFVSMESNIAAIQRDLREYQIGANYRTQARDRQVMNLEQDVDKLESDYSGLDRRVIRLEVMAK